MIKTAGLASIHRAASPNNAPTIMNVKKEERFPIEEKNPNLLCGILRQVKMRPHST